MYIEQYWEDSVGGSDDALSFLDYLEQKNQTEISVSEIFEELRLNGMNGNFRQTEEPIVFDLDDLEAEIHYAIEVITVLAALILECQKNGQFNLQDLDSDRMDRNISITCTAAELTMFKAVLKDYVENAEEYDIAEMMDEEEMSDILEGCDKLSDEL